MKLKAADPGWEKETCPSPTLKNLYEILNNHKIGFAHFRDKVLRSVFEEKYDEVGHLCFLSYSGSGKSSLIDAIAGKAKRGFAEPKPRAGLEFRTFPESALAI